MLEGVRGTARVLLQGRVVGRLHFAKGGCEFNYTDDLLDPRHHVLGQTFEESPRQRFRATTGLPAWFANLLPEQGSGLRTYYAARYGERAIDDARLLLTVGSDLPGAATVEPEDIPLSGTLVDPAVTSVDGQGVHLSALAGAQRKMSLIRDGERLTLPGTGETGDWIVKFATSDFPELAINEFLMMRWARAAGLDVPKADLVPAAGVPDIFDARIDGTELVYLVERFDRSAVGRIHIEDLAQATGSFPTDRDRGATYDGIGLLVRRLAGVGEFEEYVRRLTAMVIMGNCDAHLKNWSLRYADGRTARLAPAYDLVCTTFYSNVPRRLVFTLGSQQHPDHIGLAEFRRLAELAGHAPAAVETVVLETARRLATTWADTSAGYGSADLHAHVERRLDRHPLLRGG